MYWQKRFDRENPDKQLEDEITKIHIENKDYVSRSHHLLEKVADIIRTKAMLVK